MQYFVSATLLIAGAIHLLPLVGVASAARLARLYGVAVAEPDLELLLRHRAVLFGLLGAFLVFAVFQPRWQALAVGAGLVSVVSFIVLAHAVGGINPQLSRVVAIDWVAAVLLAAAGAALVWPAVRGS